MIFFPRLVRVVLNKESDVLCGLGGFHVMENDI